MAGAGWGLSPPAIGQLAGCPSFGCFEGLRSGAVTEAAFHGDTMTDYPDADLVVDAFAHNLAAALGAHGGHLVRIATSHSDRGFEAVFGSSHTEFTAKLSQTEQGFWGLTEEKAAQLGGGGGEHLVLLTGEDEGYFLSSVALTRLVPAFSRTRDAAARINQNKIKRERRFSDLDELALLLSQKAVPRPA